jgi:hypothetical protein
LRSCGVAAAALKDLADDTVIDGEVVAIGTDALATRCVVPHGHLCSNTNSLRFFKRIL